VGVIAIEYAFTVWLAGAGVKPAVSYGATDAFGYYPVENAVQTRDLQATLLHLLGLDHQKLTYPYQGLNQKLTGVKPAVVVEDILARSCNLRCHFHAEFHSASSASRFDTCARFCPRRFDRRHLSRRDFVTQIPAKT
jgi:hypothetical protein